MSTLTQPVPPPPQAPAGRTDPALRRLLAAMAAIFALAAVLGGALALLGAISRDTETIHTTYRGAQSVQVDTGSGDVSIVQGARAVPRFASARGSPAASPRQERRDRVQDGVLRLNSRCSSWLGGGCTVDYDVTVPPGTRVSAEVGSGDLALVLGRTPERVRASAGSGDVELTLPPASYRIDTDTGSGGVTADAALAHDDRSPRLLSVSTGSGDVDLRAGR